MKCSKTGFQVLTDLAVIFGAWFTLILAFFILGRAGYGTGLGIATMGEDQNWISLLRGETMHAVANEFWKIDGRNPLSPWLYIVARPLISSFTNGIALLQYGVGLLLAMSTYALLRLLMGRSGRWFALCTSTMVAINQANAYFDHIIWNFQFALWCTIMSIVFYIVFLRSRRQWILAYGVSLSFWCVSFYTYTLQSGAIAAIAICQLAYLVGAMKRAKASTFDGLSIENIKRIGVIFFDLIPYLATYAVFLLTWITTTPTGGGFPYEFSFSRLLSSFQTGLFHQDAVLMVEVTKLSPAAVPYVALSLCLALAWTCLIASIAPRMPTGQMFSRYLMIVLVTLSIALPTLMLESGGAAWPPGSRWRMIYQVTTPLLFMSIVGMVLSRFPARVSTATFKAVSCGLLAVLLAFSFSYNERQVSLTRSEAMVRQAMHDVIIQRQNEGDTGPLLIVLEMDDSFHWLATEALRSVYMKTWFPDIRVEYRILPSPSYVPSNPTRLRFSQFGVSIATENSIPTSYDRVVLLLASGKTVSRRFSISREEVVSHNGEWQVSGDFVTFRQP